MLSVDRRRRQSFDKMMQRMGEEAAGAAQVVASQMHMNVAGLKRQNTKNLNVMLGTERPPEKEAGCWIIA